MVMKAGDKHWKKYTTNYDGVLTFRIHLQRITGIAAEMLKIFKFIFFAKLLVNSGITQSPKT